tara:strand:+ start:645 stop:1259 length:615 start_codon:yes stop_codon:yes gene_type:complete
MRTKRKFKPIPKDIGDYLAYSEESSTGLINKVSRNYRAKKGQESGSINSRGYYLIFFKSKSYLSHRIVYFLNTGIDPEEKQVDHIDRNRLNNKISNLRLATNKQNQDNRRKQKNNTSGVTGVTWHKRDNRYYADISHNKKKLSLGYFNKSDEAVAVRIAAETDPRFKDQEFRHPHNDKHAPSPEMLVWAKQYLEDRIERLNWNI